MNKNLITRLGIISLLLGIMLLGYGGNCNDSDTSSGSSAPVVLTQATSPTPADEATGVALIQQLTWAAVTGASSYNVYFGTVNPPSSIANTTNITYNPGTLSYNTTYYWRIDAKSTYVTATGHVWSFQTEFIPADQVTTSNPADGATNVALNPTMTWTAASGATSYDVYFGTSSPPTYITNTITTTYEPGTLSATTTYYWRIDSRNVLGPTTGNIWSFQTSAAWTKVAAGALHALAIKTDGTLWAWGMNDYGELGVGDIITRKTPVQVGTGTNWSIIAADSRFSLAIKTDGTLWAWGRNFYGELGIGSTDGLEHPNPIQIGTDTWSAIAAGSCHVVGIKTDGTIWAWGRNDFYQLGQGDKVNRSSPTKVGTDTDWIALDAGSDFTIAMKSNKHLWGWGINQFDQLGLGDGTDRPIPVNISNATDWSAIVTGYSSSYGLKNDNTLWAWGGNGQGQLGVGDELERSWPNQVGSNVWSTIIAGVWKHVMHIKTNGTLWTCGDNQQGQLGLDDTEDRDSLEQIGTDTDWATAACGDQFTIAIKTDGTLWSWGYNSAAQLGLGDNTDRHVPTAVK